MLPNTDLHVSIYFEKKIKGIEQPAGELMSQTLLCDQRRKALLEHCREGYKLKYWAGLDE
jgi:hypothetical protein